MTEVKKEKSTGEIRHRSMFVQTFLRIFDTPTAKIGGILFFAIVILCLGAPLFTPYGIND